MKYLLIRSILRMGTLPYKIYPLEGSPVRIPPKFHSYFDSCPETVAQQVVSAYIQVFGEPPWNEIHDPETILCRLYDEIESGFLTTMSSPLGVVGFSWGALIPKSQISQRILRTKSNFTGVRQLLANLPHTKSDSILFYDEFAITSTSRGGLTPIQFLLRPGLELAFNQGVKSLIFWTSWKSNIANLSVYMGFEPLCESEGIVFLVNRDFTPLLKITQNLKQRKIARLMKLTSRL
ncbi:hypothetical protein A2X44_01350 [candidate division CPR3 bacterium GWF2_35_18]|uniref:N-acetyltransferase domain-containing protein n=1 Tax=candidate division CPR3 bacterium GW2011_GWF2_35_18 TaxID=1618350 RepID=A0A0G0E4S0_UNCC3|nr:MAG: hypothetical protein UR67_C0001G0249 [candidate division CPR3 bacterium GW2011_GWF2_35_18]OGB63548.1 MAG: hypothetical protein A2X44_01350 [candidate division CPR3 bacterium GWF2_35_18]OGB64657.1 MAG: hypothetical protein A2250_03900 [candidate division CPR3 bacterium RIFOXYA2_FULL_35_13]OGB76540.1 MAG: hypothetical protein A2476_05380 [candidate division CPR3 bacterium RIFOXYC2_FULL_35_7]OGB78768.1 MAG: hypothetical protein A2296_00145 [candidate division CPR3 bacterium RIFOXYB2_FULL_3